MIALAVVVGCSTETTETAADKEEAAILAARVGDWKLTRADIDRIIETMDDSDQLKYDTPGGRAELTTRMIEEELYHQEGLKLGLDEDPLVQEAVDRYTRTLLINRYFHDKIQPLAVPTDEEMFTFYEENQEQYKSQAIARAQHIFSSSKDKLVGLLQRIEEGERMTELAMKYSEDELTMADGGDLGYFNPDGYIRGVGYSKMISDAVFSMEPGVVSEPIKWEKGWSLIRVNELRPAKYMTFEEAEPDIKLVMAERRIDHVKHVAFEELSKKYAFQNYLADEMKLTQRTPEELWNLAQNSQDSYQRLVSYHEIVERSPESEYAAQALFMVGFVHAEELKDNVEADRAFTRVLNEYPDSEVAKSAAWMLENMQQPLPEFESIDELNEKISAESDD
jgi:hypothetical protein